MQLYNSLTRKLEEFIPLNPPQVGLYTCGPTVYGYASIGNFRTYTMADLLLRALQFNNYQVKYIMNLTDVGHLTGDNLGDADTGEDRIEKTAKAAGRSAWDIARFYSDAFIADFEKLALVKPEAFVKATDHIADQIALVARLEKNGFTYRTSDGLYFDTALFEKNTGKKYGVLSDLDQIKEGARVAKNPEKKNPRDFALWKFSPTPGERQMEWDSPWGLGFPGWHLECSAMSMKYLGNTFDLHTGGEDLKSTHHPNEIAQSEAATGQPFVRYWVHVRFLQVDGKRMGKSLGNVYTVSDLQAKNFDPLALRYFYLTGHYREPLNFTFKALTAAQNSLNNLKSIVADLRSPRPNQRTRLSEEKLAKIDDYRARFTQAINADLNTPQALSVLWEVAKSNLPSPDKLDLLLLFDEVFGFNLNQIKSLSASIPPEVQKLLTQREAARKAQDYPAADLLRKQINSLGYSVKDTPQGVIVKPEAAHHAQNH